MMVDAHGEFAAAVRENRAPLIDADEGTRAVELANAIYASAIARHAVDLPLVSGTYASVFEGLARGTTSIFGPGTTSDSLPGS